MAVSAWWPAVSKTPERYTATPPLHYRYMGAAGQRYRGLSPTGREVPGVATLAPIRSATGWELIHHNPRTLIVVCIQCQRGVVNETNQMRRAGWQESTFSSRRIYRCGDCSKVACHD